MKERQAKKLEGETEMLSKREMRRCHGGKKPKGKEEKGIAIEKHRVAYDVSVRNSQARSTLGEPRETILQKLRVKPEAVRVFSAPHPNQVSGARALTLPR